MHAIMFRRQGGPEVLESVDVPRPAPGPGEALVRVTAAALNYSDVMRRRGDSYPFPTPLPFMPGSEMAGIVEALGEGVAAPAIGTRVFGATGAGCHAEYVVAPAAQLHAIPPGLDDGQAAGLIVAGGTAALLLREAARLQQGESIFIPAATGGVGSYAVPLARMMGAPRVIAGVGDAAKRQAALALGASDVIDTSAPDWPAALLAATGGQGVDVLLEMQGGQALEAGLAALAPFGRAIVFGKANMREAALGAAAQARLLYDPARNQSVQGFNLGGYIFQRPAALGAAMGALLGGMMQGQVIPPRVTAMPLASAADAHRLLESRAVIGKLVLTP